MNENLLIKYLTHTATEEELKEVERWLSSDKRNAEWLFDMERILSLKDELKYSDEKRVSEAFSQFMFSVSDKEETPVRINDNSRRLWLRNFMRYAAAVIITFTVSFAVFNLVNPAKETMITYNTVEVPKGQRASLLLSDGTKVWLNSDSKLIYPSHFSEKERTVKLEGEGYFEVSHNPEKPFVVDGELLDVRVLGTKFNFKSYKEEDVSVTLTEGKVEVSTSDGENSLTLNPDEQVIYSPEAGIVLNKDIDTDLHKSWMKGEVVFQNQPLSVICKDLERKFDVVISIKDAELSDKLFTCRFKDNLNINQVMDLLEATRELDYMIDDRNIVIISNPGSN